MSKYYLDDSIGMYILKRLRHLGPQYQGEKVKPGIWWFNRPLKEIIIELEKLDRRRLGEVPWIPERELSELFKRYYRATGDLSGLVNLARTVIQWRRQVGLPIPSWVEDIYKNATS